MHLMAPSLCASTILGRRVRSLACQGPQQTKTHVPIRTPGGAPAPGSQGGTWRLHWRSSAWRAAPAAPVMSVCCPREVLRKLSAAATRRTDPRAVLRQAERDSRGHARHSAGQHVRIRRSDESSRQLAQASDRVTPSEGARRPRLLRVLSFVMLSNLQQLRSCAYLPLASSLVERDPPISASPLTNRG